MLGLDFSLLKKRVCKGEGFSYSYSWLHHSFRSW